MPTYIDLTNLSPATITALSSTAPTITQIQITTSGYVVKDDTAVSTSGGYIKITGTNFTAGTQVVIGSATATSVTFVSSTVLNVQVPAQTAGTYIVYVTVSNGGVAILVNGLTYSGDPTWVTGSTLPAGQINSAISIQFSATGDAPVTYALQAGSTLPPGLSLTSGGLLSGTVTGLTNDTTYNFTVEAIDGQAQESPRAFSITIAANDQLFEYVTTLLSASNPTSTFVTDASTNNFAVTVFGDTRPNNFGPYTPGYYSAFFDGTGDFLSVADNAALEFGNSTLTLEMWINTAATTQYTTLSSRETSGFSSGMWALQVNGSGANSGDITFFAADFSVSAPLLQSTGNKVNDSTWHHVAIVRNVNSWALYIDGVSRNTATWSGTVADISGAFYIGASQAFGRNYTGYISNLRFVKGTAVYTAAFTPPTTPLTAITNTQLLTCQSNRFIDNSTNNFTVTRVGDTLISGFDPFIPLSAYSTYGSGYFDGSGDYLSLAGNTAFTMPGNFTAEAWVYCNGYTNDYAAIFGFSSDSENTGWNILVRTNGRLHFNVAMTFTDATGTLPLNQWTHIALVRSGSGSGNVKLYVNGVADATTLTVTATATSPSTVMLGSYPGITSRAFNGYIMDARIVKGTAVYTSTFTPPTAPLTAIANTSLLTLQNNQPNNNNMFLDSSTNNFLITRNGNTTQGSFNPYTGTYSVFFPNASFMNSQSTSGAFLRVTNTTAFDAGTGDFTMEGWIYPLSMPSSDAWPSNWWQHSVLFGRGSPSLGDGSELLMGATKLIYQNNDSAIASGNHNIVPNQWYHVAACRSSGTLRLFVNGAQVASASFSGSFGGGSNWYVGTETGEGAYFNGFISNMRFVVGTALYTSAFTVPTAPLIPVTNTRLMLCADNRLIDDSPNFYTVTAVNGPPTIQRFSPFPPQPQQMPTSYSLRLSGTSGEFINAPANSAFSLGTGNFTLEAWVYTGTNSGFQPIIEIRTAAANSTGIVLGRTSGAYTLNVYTNGAFVGASTSSITQYAWNHVALVRSGSTCTYYINGTASGTFSLSANLTDGATTGPKIGGSTTTGEVWNGLISNARITKGQALYTSNFTPSTTPLTTTSQGATASNVSLLTCQSSTIIDNSINGFAMTINGTPFPILSNPFGYTNPGTAQYTPATYGGSMYFDGTDYLTLASNSAFNIFNGDMTVECWFYATSLANSPHIFAFVQDATNRESIYFASSALTFWTSSSAGNGPRIATSALSLNTWYHMALVKSGSTFTLYLNGTSVGTSTTTQYSTSNQTLQIGTYNSGSFAGDNFTGYISNVRIVKGQALYTSSFAPPMAPLSFNANTVLQVNGTSAAIYDSAMITTYETVADAKSTGVLKKYGNSSIAFDGTGDALYAPWVPSLELGAGSFTIEFWAYIVGGNALYCWSTDYHYAMTFNYGGANANRVGIWASSNGSSWNIFNADGGGNGISTGTITTNTWTHVALVRNGSTWTLYLNGTSAWTGTSSATIVTRNTDIFRIGGPWPVAGPTIFNGYMDDFRITNGIARYTSNFTPPTTPFIQY